MRRIVMWTLAGAFLMGASLGQSKPYPNRWVRVSSSLRDDGEIERIRQIAETAARGGLTGIVLSAGLDQLDLKPPDYFRRLQKVRDLCAELKLEIIPSFMSVGYGGSVLAHDRNLAAGLPVRDALFAVRRGKARFVADPAPELVNGGFERHTVNGIEGFTSNRPFGEMIVVDRAVSREGNASVRFENFTRHPREWARLSQVVAVRPYRLYRLSCWMRAENMGASNPFGSGNFLLEVLGGADRRPLQYQNPRTGSGGEWQKVAVAFNSWGYDSVEIAPKVRGTGEGKFWLDDLRVEEVGMVNLLRRPGTPLTVRSEDRGIPYREGRDFAPVADPQLNFRFDHDGPEIELMPGGRIAEGERVRVSFYHGTNIYNGQTPVCMSEPKLYEIWRTQARLVHEALAPSKYLLNMDEVRTGGSCVACKERGLTMGQILADCVTKQFEMFREVNPRAEIYVWSDMLDPNHNANPERKFYYLAEGGYAGSWNHIPREIGIVCWYFEKRIASLRHFSALGFRTVAGAYYDGDDLDNPKAWLEALRDIPGASGILYTTWLNKYDLLGPFAELVSEAKGSGR